MWLDEYFAVRLFDKVLADLPFNKSMRKIFFGNNEILAKRINFSKPDLLRWFRKLFNRMFYNKFVCVVFVCALVGRRWGARRRDCEPDDCKIWRWVWSVPTDGYEPQTQRLPWPKQKTTSYGRGDKLFTVASQLYFEVIIVLKLGDVKNCFADGPRLFAIGSQIHKNHL